MAVAIDTHEFFNKLKNVGFSVEQAEVITTLHKETTQAFALQSRENIEQIKHEYRLDDITTNKDLDARIRETELKIELVRKEISENKKDLEIKIGESKAELVRWVIGAGFLQVALISGLILRLAEKL